MARYMFITGGVVSSLGKGLASAALGALLQARGYKVRLRKLDPYLNVDPGTMSPYQHGEVFVTDDGAETDLDLGHYERFTGRPATRPTTSPPAASTRRSSPANGAATISAPPCRSSRTSPTPSRISSARATTASTSCSARSAARSATSKACRSSKPSANSANDLPRQDAIYIHLTLLPYIPSAGEMKTKPTQHSVKELRSIGIQPDILLCRCDRPIPDGERRKIALFCNVREERGDRGARRRQHLRSADGLSRGRPRQRSARGFRRRSGGGARSRRAGG